MDDKLEQDLNEIEKCPACDGQMDIYQEEVDENRYQEIAECTGCGRMEG